jgi:hypothetical protein
MCARKSVHSRCHLSWQSSKRFILVSKGWSSSAPWLSWLARQTVTFDCHLKVMSSNLIGAVLLLLRRRYTCQVCKATEGGHEQNNGGRVEDNGHVMNALRAVH